MAFLGKISLKRWLIINLTEINRILNFDKIYQYIYKCLFKYGDSNPTYLINSVAFLTGTLLRKWDFLFLSTVAALLLSSVAAPYHNSNFGSKRLFLTAHYIKITDLPWKLFKMYKSLYFFNRLYQLITLRLFSNNTGAIYE